MELRTSQTLKSILLLAGSFIFAFLIGETTHEFGHYLAHLVYGTSDVRVHLDPFGGSHIAGVASLPVDVAAVTSAAGPLLNLALGLSFFLMLWRVRRPALLPLLLWGPVAMVQESVTFSLGLLTPGGDAQLIAAAGIPRPVILIAGICLLVMGLGTIALLLPDAGVEADDPPSRKFWIVLAGMCSLMFVRFIFGSLMGTVSATENLVPLVFSLLLAGIVVLLQQPVTRSLASAFPSRRSVVTWRAPAFALTLGVGIFLFQILALN